MHVLLDEMDNGEVFYVKIPLNDLLSCKVSLCEGFMTTYCLKEFLNSYVPQQLVKVFCTWYNRNCW